MHLDEFKTHSNGSAILQSETSQAILEIRGEAVFGVRIAGIGLLVPKVNYCEVLDKIQVNALPNVHPWLSGIVNLRGNLIPVFDLRLMLEEQATDNKKRRLMAIDKGNKAVALWIDGFPEIKYRELLQPLIDLPLLPQILQSLVIGGYTQAGQVWLDVKFEDLFKVLGRHQYASEMLA